LPKHKECEPHQNKDDYKKTSNSVRNTAYRENKKTPNSLNI